MVSSLAIPLSRPVDPASLIALGAIDFRVEKDTLFLTMPWDDPWSWRLLLRRLDQPSSAPGDRDVAARRDRWLDAGLLDEQRVYWERKLVGIADCAAARRIEKLNFAIPPCDYNTGLTALIELLACYTGETDICVGISAPNRHRPGSAEVIGPLANVLGIRVDAAAPDLALEVAQTLLEAVRHQDFPNARTFAAMFLPETVEGATWITPRSRAGLTLTSDGFEYDPERYTADTIASMAGHFRNLLTTGEMPGALEREQLAIWNRTGTAYREAPVHELIRVSDAIAVSSQDRTLTYRELLERADRMAARLQQLGVGPDSVVGVLLERSEHLPVAIVAIWKAGGAYLPLDPAFPMERLDFMMRDSGAHVLIAERNLAQPVTAGHTVFTEDGFAADGPELGPSGVTIENLACILYTSGSTGQPKGTAIGHRNLINLIHAVLAETRFGSNDVLLALATVAFDAAAMELFAPLVAGGRVEVAGRDLARDSRGLARLIGRCRPTLMFATPATWRMLVESGWEGSPGMRIMCGGELFRTDLMAALRARSAAVWHVYGPTETTVFSTMYRVDGEVVGDRIPIGKPIANTTVSVRDARGRVVPIGMAGELWIGGHGVSRGYLNRPELNAQKFSDDGQFRTGDRVRFRQDGNLEFLGRLDSMTKVRGNRVEAGEVEAALLACPGVRAAAVLADSNSIAAYLVGDAAVGLVRAHIGSRLPEFMVPSTFIYLEAMPLTATGKIDRLALPHQPTIANGAGEKPFVAPRTQVEKVVASIFAEVLRVDRVAADDDFFHLGGHSLLGAQVLSRVWETWDVELSARVLFESPTVEGLAARIHEMRMPTRGVALRGSPAIEPLSHAPLSYAQQRLWFLDNLYQADRALYNIPLVVRVVGRFDLQAFERALNEVVRRHESLRTNFGNSESEPVQFIAPERTIEVRLRDRESALAEAGRPFDLARDPLIRASVAETAANEFELIVVMHHIVSDGWSFGVLLREINTLLHGGSLAPLPMQYADFAQRERETLTDAVLATRLQYWRERLAGAPAVLELPTDHPRAPVQTFRGARLEFSLPRELADTVNRFCAQERATPFMVLLAAFHILLRRYTGETDISVGTPVANRTRVETEGLIGFFVNTLVLRTAAAVGTSFHELLAAVRNTALDAFAHQDVPFQKLVEALRPDRALTHTPFFQVVFAVQNADSGTLDMPGVVTKSSRLVSDYAKFDVTVTIENTDGAIAGAIEYNRDLFDADRMERMVGHFGTLLSSAIAEPVRSIDELPILTRGEERQFATWNQTRADYPHAAFPVLFAAQVAKAPDAIAAECEGHRWTYADLDARSNAVAAYLRARGVAPEMPVGIVVERSLEMMAGMLGIWKAGGAYVPIDPEYPAERQAFMRQDCGLTIVLTKDNIAALDSAAAAASPLTLDSLAYILYTSGSTGKPKGVAIEHGSLINLLEAMRRKTGIGPKDATLALASATFDMSVPEFWLPLIVGARVVIALRDDARDGFRLRRLTEISGATIMLGTPTTWTMLLDQGWLPDDGFRLICGGEAVPESLKNRMAALPCVSWNIFGPTETCVCSTMAILDAGPVTIGRPISNTRLYVLDANGNPAPIGIAGELLIAGDGVGRGYWNRPELTAEKFGAGPMGDRVYRTGDRVRWRADGRLEFIERMDSQVKLRGFRIELGEIETALEKCAGIRAAAVGIREDQPGDKQLVAYLAAESIDERDLRRTLGRELPEYMIPSRFVTVETLPLSANGKVDRRALLALKEGPQTGREPDTAPSTQAEEAIANIFADVLRVEHVNVDDDFFHLGGHSLLATRVVSQIREKLRVEMALRTLFEAPTVRGLARRIEEDRRVESGPALRRYERTGGEPVSFAQQRLWFLDRYYEGETPMYNIAETIALTGPLATGRLRDAIAGIVARHETLRTSFRQTGGVPVQTIAASSPIELEVEAVDENELNRSIAREVGRPFELSRGSLIRVKLYRLGPDRHVLLIVLHHVISDMWSFGIFHRELRDRYAGHTIAPLQVQYADFAQWQREWLSAERLEYQAAYWKGRLMGAPPFLELPADRPRPATQTFRAGNYAFRLTREQTDAVKRYSQREGATLFMTLVAAFQALMARYTGTTDICVGTLIANRTRVETEELIGFFANTLVLRTNVAGDQTFHHLLSRVRDTTLDAYAHQDLPFEKLVEILEPERNPAYTPLFQVLLNLHILSDERFTMEGLDAVCKPVEPTTARFDITLDMEDRGGHLECFLNYNRDLFEAGRMERMSGHFVTLLTAAIAEPERTIAELPLLTATELRELAACNETRRHYPQAVFPERFAAQAAKAPGRVAVECNGQSITYAELNARANAVASFLRQRGVAPESPVGIVVERSIEMVVGLLGIWKAGGAYVPVDPGHPEERQSKIREDSGVTIVLTPAAIARMGSSESEIASGVKLENLAYLMYTSGSTGHPKGVAITHRSVANLLESMLRDLRITERDTMVAITTASFDISVLELWLPLMVGARVVVATRDETREGIRLRRLAEQTHATVMQGTPTSWMMLLDAGWRPPVGFQILCGGEALPAHLWDRLAKLDRVAWNLFGPTETTVWSTMARIETGRVSIGRPIANTSVYVLDRQRQPVPIGVPGDLYIGGEGVARGYWRRPELTRERFVSLADGERVFYTGDRVRRRDDGQLEFLERVDNQIKLRGFRIELGEIEAALARHPGVVNVAVNVRAELIIAYLVISANGETITEEDLRDTAARRLPDYMIPSRFVILDALPLSANGKVDRRALPSVQGARVLDPQPIAEAPDDELERNILNVWQSVFESSSLSVRDNFFSLGGHSLQAARLVAKMEEQAGIRVPLSALFSAPTVRQLAAHLRSTSDASRNSGLAPIQPLGSARPIFMAGARGMFYKFAQLLGPDQPFLGMPWPDLPELEAPYSIPQIASLLVRRMRSRQPHGPYILGGWCIAATVAYEMAQQLTEQGETVDLLMFFDGANVSRGPHRSALLRLRDTARFYAASTVLNVRRISGMGAREGAAFTAARTFTVLKHVNLLFWSTVSKLLSLRGHALGEPGNLRDMERAVIIAAFDYQTRPYAGRVVYFKRGVLPNLSGDAATFWWGPLLSGGLEIYDTTGRHGEMFESPHVDALAGKVRELLAGLHTADEAASKDRAQAALQ